MKKLWIGVIVIAVVVLVAMMMYQPASNTQSENVAPATGSGSGSSIGMVNNSNSGGTSAGSETTNPATGSDSGQTTGQDGITMAELAAHDSKNDCWVAYDGEVYDITKFLPVHPGGSRAIEQYCGTESEFVKAFTGQHGTKQVAKLKNQEFIGNLV